MVQLDVLGLRATLAMRVALSGAGLAFPDLRFDLQGECAELRCRSEPRSGRLKGFGVVSGVPSLSQDHEMAFYGPFCEISG